MLLSDGTRNSAAKLFKTNVWRLYGALDLSDAGRQVAYYDDGIGTSSFRPLAVLGGIMGFGLKRNVLDLYRFACRTYRPGDRIFGFGFSRGAFTIRIVAGFIAREGLVPYAGNEAQLARDALAAYRAFRRRFNVTGGLVGPLRWVRDRLARSWRRLRGLPQFDPSTQIQVDAIHFLGVWDTVAAYGGPIEEVTRGIDYWLWPLSMPDRFMSAKVRRACQALALDDERNAFWPVLWDESQVSDVKGLRPMMERWVPPAHPNLPDIDRQRLSQVWFTGMHSDVGGGYARDGLSYVVLDWMLDRALAYDLLLKPLERARVGQLADKLDKLNDSRHGLGGYYRYKPRKLADIYELDPYKPTIRRDLARAVRRVKEARSEGGRMSSAADAGAGGLPPLIHESVFERIAAGLDGYSPIVLPEAYRVTTKAGVIRTGVYEHASQAVTRTRRQERAWNWVWLRRVVYFATVFASSFVVALPLIVQWWPGPNQPSWAAFLVPAIDLGGRFLPGLAAPWIETFKAAPELFATGAVLVAILLFWGGSLHRRVGDVMLAIWRPIVGQPPHQIEPSPVPHDILYRMRTSAPYRAFFYGLTHWVLPTLCAVLIVCGVSLAGWRVLSAVIGSLSLWWNR